MNVRRARCALCACRTLWLMMVVCHAEILFIAERLPLKGDRTQSDVPWPMPETWSRESRTTFTLTPSSLTFHSDVECDVISKAVTRYRDLLGQLRDDGTLKEGQIRRVDIEFGACETLPRLDMDESYTIVTGADKVIIHAKSSWGALRGLDTFSQLPFEDNGQVKMKNWTISDKPRFSHRGFMIDTSRHYLPLPIIKKHLDGMAWSKLNVLHWHIVDSQSFPFVSKTFPELSGKGAFTPRHVYEPEVVAEVIEHARLRGIRVLPEFDTPGHAGSWGKGRPDLLTPCWHNGQPRAAEYGSHAEAENFDPTKDSTYTFLAEIMKEVKDVFKDAFLHAGMDEAHYMCWESSPNISDFMQQKKFNNSYPLLEQYYVTRALEIISSVTQKDVIIWQDPIDHGVTVVKGTLVEVWKNDRDVRNCNQTSEDSWQGYARAVAKSGNRMLISSCWYLNYICYGEDWRRFYACDPQSFTDNVEEQKLVVGGEACMWAEFVDGTNFLQRSWPRAAAVAERLWSPSHVTDPDNAVFRLDSHRCRLLRRGIPAEPVLPGYCGDFEYGFEHVDTVGASQRNGGEFHCFVITLMTAAFLLI